MTDLGLLDFDPPPRIKWWAMIQRAVAGIVLRLVNLAEKGQLPLTDADKVLDEPGNVRIWFRHNGKRIEIFCVEAVLPGGKGRFVDPTQYPPRA